MPLTERQWRRKALFADTVRSLDGQAAALPLGHQSRREHQNVWIIGQGDARHSLRRIQGKVVGVEIESALVFGAVVEIAICHGYAFRFVREILRGEPVAEA